VPRHGKEGSALFDDAFAGDAHQLEQVVVCGQSQLEARRPEPKIEQGPGVSAHGQRLAAARVRGE